MKTDRRKTELKGTPKMATVMQHAFKKAGMSPEDWRLKNAIYQYRKSGGSAERVLELAAEVDKELPGEAARRVPKGQVSPASTRQPDEDGGHPDAADEATQTVPPSSPPRPELVVRVQPTLRGIEDGRFKPHPVKRPTAAELKASAEARNAGAKSVLQSFRVRDGRAIGEVRRGEARTLIGNSRHETFVLTLCQQHIDRFNPTADMLKTFAELISVKDMEKIIQDSARLANYDGEGVAA